MADFRSVETAVREIRATREKLEQRLEKARLERDELAAAPLSNADVIGLVTEALDRDAEDAPRRLKHLVESLRSRPMRDPDAPLDIWSYALPGKERIGYVLVSLLAPEIKQAMAEVIADMPEDEASGPSLADRRNRIEKLDVEIDAAMTELDELRQQARRAGVTLRGAPL